MRVKATGALAQNMAWNNNRPQWPITELPVGGGPVIPDQAGIPYLSVGGLLPGVAQSAQNAFVMPRLHNNPFYNLADWNTAQQYTQRSFLSPL